MAWQSIAKTQEMLATLSDGWETKGGQRKPKGGGKTGKASSGGAKPQENSGTRLCPWADCRAAVNKQATWGGGPGCHCCKRSFAKTPPVEQLVEWAYKEMLDKKQKDGGGGKDAAKGAPGKGAQGKGGPAPAATGKGGRDGKGTPPVAPQAEELAALLIQMQAEICTDLILKESTYNV